ncbi:MAG: 6-carboxytetrahydropterin synthase QueD [Crocosphaera sp.]|nr:6-carboxytetrahydropterin synthase QueD [Crocosphaera sp.]
MNSSHQWTIYKEFRFEAAHRLPHHQGKCCRLHGHSWVGRVYVSRDYLETTGPKQGMVMDFGDISNFIDPLVETYLDHYYLNETTGLESPTSEAIAQWIFEKLEAAKLPGLSMVEIRETCTSGAQYSRRNQ